MRLVAMRKRQVQRKAQRAAAARADVAIPSSGGAPLDAGVRGRMEQQLGADLSAARVHSGGESAAAAEALGARAFTVGSDVHFAAGQLAPGSKEGDKLLAHELTHVVQGQRSGIQRKPDAAEGDAGGHDVSQPHEPAEQEADAVSEHVAGKLHGDEKPHAATSAAGATTQAAPPIAAKLAAPRIFRAGNGPVPDAALHEKAGAGNLKETTSKSSDGKSDQALVNTGPHSMAANPDFEKDAIAFEDKLGAKVWAHPAAQAGASEMAKKAKAYIQDKVGGQWDAANGELQAIAQQIGIDNPGWSGSVGKAVKDVMAVFDGGNISEQLTHVGEFFTKVLAKDLVEMDAKDLEKRLAQAKLDGAGLMKRREEMLAKKDARGGKANNWDIAPTMPGSPTADQWHARANRADAAGVAPDDKKGRSQVAKSDRTLAQTGVDMSAREEALVKKDDAGWSKDTDKLKWEEGVKVWMINERDKWVQLQRSLSLPLGAGPSGTTNMLMHAASALKADKYNARMACIAKLLPAHHHTLVEILAAAGAHGCDYTTGQKMYRDLKPMSEAELRACGKDGKFPDETAKVTS
jgi:hypothetical protein